MNTHNKIDGLNEIAREISEYQELEIAKNANHPVPGEGDPDSRIMFIGEAPGYNEDLQGRPFVGQAGKLLEKTLLEIGLQRQQVFITNIVKYRPPDNRDPLPQEIDACANWLDRQIMLIQPEFVVTLGRFSMAKFIPETTISRVHGVPHRISFQKNDHAITFTVFPMYHPAAALRSGNVLVEFKKDFQKLAQLLNTTTTPNPPVNNKPPDNQVIQPGLF